MSSHVPHSKAVFSHNALVNFLAQMDQRCSRYGGSLEWPVFAQNRPFPRGRSAQEKQREAEGERDTHTTTPHPSHTLHHTPHTPPKEEKGDEPNNEPFTGWLLGSIVLFLPLDTRFVSLSMKFQASRFSASGRKVPLEPRRSEACRSCQPMHVLSFGEGRKLKVFVSITEFCIQAFGVLTHLCFHRAFGVKSCDHGYTLRLRGRQSPLFVGWRFDKCVFGSHSKSVASAASVAYFPL